MGYQVKWVEEHLGITRNSIRKYEEKGLMPKNNGLYREYDDEDIQRLWAIKVFLGIGLKLDEIKTMVEEDLDFISIVKDKIKDLEMKLTDTNRSLGYAKQIAYSGRFPLFPKELGNMTFKEFQENALQNFNLNNMPIINDNIDFYNKIISEDFDINNLKDDEIGCLFKMILDFSKILNDEKYKKGFLIEQYELEIIKRMSNGIESIEVQTLVSLIYDAILEIYDEQITKEQFGRIHGSQYLYGLVAEQTIKKYGLKECQFIAVAFAVFAGYKNNEDIENSILPKH